LVQAQEKYLEVCDRFVSEQSTLEATLAERDEAYLELLGFKDTVADGSGTASQPQGVSPRARENRFPFVRGFGGGAQTPPTAGVPPL
jgi:hypothetical protein